MRESLHPDNFPRPALPPATSDATPGREVQRPSDVPQPDTPDVAVADSASPLGDLPEARVPSERQIATYPQRPVPLAAGGAAVETTIAGDDEPRRDRHDQPAPPSDIEPATPGDGSGPPPPPDNSRSERGGADEPRKPIALQTFEFLAGNSVSGTEWHGVEANLQASHAAADLSLGVNAIFTASDLDSVDSTVPAELSDQIRRSVENQLERSEDFADVLDDCANLCEEIAAYADMAEERPVVVTSPSTPLVLHEPIDLGQYEVVARRDRLEITEGWPEAPDPNVQQLVRYEENGVVQFVHPNGTGRNVITPGPDGYTRQYQEIITVPLGTATYARALQVQMRGHAALLRAAEAQRQSIGIVAEELIDHLRSSAARLWNMLDDSTSYILAEKQDGNGARQIATAITRYGDALLATEEPTPTRMDDSRHREPTGEADTEVERATRAIAADCSRLFTTLRSLGDTDNEQGIVQRVDQAVDTTKAYLNNPHNSLAQMEETAASSRAMIQYAATMENRVIHDNQTTILAPGTYYRTGQYTVQPTAQGLEVTEQLPDNPDPNQTLARYDLPDGIVQLTAPNGNQHWRFQQTPNGGLQVTTDVFIGLAPGTADFFRQITELLEHQRVILAEYAKGGLTPYGAQFQLVRSLMMINAVCRGVPGASESEPRPSLRDVEKATQLFIATIIDRS